MNRIKLSEFDKIFKFRGYKDGMYIKDISVVRKLKDFIKRKEEEILDEAIKALPEKIDNDPLGNDDFIAGTNATIETCKQKIISLKK